MEIIITDLTRFSNQAIVCIAGINPENNECIRPMPYIQKKYCRELNILPGAIIEGIFTKCPCSIPHNEDRKYKGELKYLGPCSSDEFNAILATTSVNSVEEGFNVDLVSGQKHIPYDTPPETSIITLSLNPHDLSIVPDNYKPDKLRVIFTDNSCKSYRNLSITDLGFFEWAERYAKDDKIDDLNTFIHSQKELFIRLGLSRIFQADDGRNGYWLQVNGIYTFPHFNEAIRCYS